MNNIVEEYMKSAWLVANIFMGKDFILSNCSQNEEYKANLYNYDSFKKLLKLLDVSDMKVQIFDKTKLETINSIINEYLHNHSNIDNNSFDICNKILKLANKNNKKNVSNFYLLQYYKRNHDYCKKVTPEVKDEIDLCLINDVKLLNNLTSYLSGDKEEKPVNDISFLKSINAFIYDIPEFFYEDKLYNYVNSILIKNKEYDSDSNFNKLNRVALKELGKISLNKKMLDKMLLKERILSILFHQDVNHIIDKLDDEGNFFTDEVLSIICEFVKEGTEHCIFDKRRRDNARELLLRFYDKNMLNNSELNDMKRFLNVLDNDEYRNKNKLVYKAMAMKYIPYDCLIENYDEFKNQINYLIQNNYSTLLKIIDLSVPTEELAKNPNICYYICYIMNDYPIIYENSVYMNRIQNIIFNYYELIEDRNDYHLTKHTEKKLKEKIKKLY